MLSPQKGQIFTAAERGGSTFLSVGFFRGTRGSGGIDRFVAGIERIGGGRLGRWMRALHPGQAISFPNISEGTSRCCLQAEQ